jgi:hypothetical protein
MSEVLAFAELIEGRPMDFFERVFHISLDGGNGVAEFAVILGTIAIATSALLRKCLPRNGIGKRIYRRLVLLRNSQPLLAIRHLL